MSTGVSIVAWSSAALGALLFFSGLIRTKPAQAVLGLSVAANALTLRSFVPLGSGQPLSTMDRVWGASGATVGGWAVLSLLLAIHWSHRTGRSSWLDPGMLKRWAGLTVLAVASIAALHETLLWPGQDLAPSTDFLNDYGDRPNVVAYQLIFAFWLGVPVALLGWTTWRFLRGAARWITTVGCGFGVFWAVWKIVGTILRYFSGDQIALESPVSVISASLSLVLVVVGLLIGRTGVWLNRFNARRGYRAALRSYDGRHYDPEADSTDSTV